jgi:hypothetical protein
MKEIYIMTTIGFDERKLQIDFERAIKSAIQEGKNRFKNHDILKALVIIDEGEDDVKVVSNLQKFVKEISLKACEAVGIRQTNLDILNAITRRGRMMTLVEIVFIKPVSQTNENPAVKNRKLTKRSSIVKIIARTIRKKSHCLKNRNTLYG